MNRLDEKTPRLLLQRRDCTRADKRCVRGLPHRDVVPEFLSSGDDGVTCAGGVRVTDQSDDTTRAGNRHETRAACKREFARADTTVLSGDAQHRPLRRMLQSPAVASATSNRESDARRQRHAEHDQGGEPAYVGARAATKRILDDVKRNTGGNQGHDCSNWQRDSRGRPDFARDHNRRPVPQVPAVAAVADSRQRCSPQQWHARQQQGDGGGDNDERSCAGHA